MKPKFSINDIEHFPHPNAEELNTKLDSLLTNWANNRPDRRSVSDFPTYFPEEFSWHSPDNLYELEPFQDLKNFVEEHVSKKLGEPLRIFSMWSIVGRNKSHGQKHRHLGKHTGVYYVNNGHVNGEEISGQINYYTVEGTKTFSPKNGEIFFFPAKMFHDVNPYLGDRHRTVIVFNLK